jgi:acyl carrier protein
MLSSGRNEVRDEKPAPIEARVLELIAETCGLVRCELALTTPLAEALDSLTLVAVVARLEAAFGIELGGEETIELLAARDVGELGRLLARKLELARESPEKHQKLELPAKPLHG